VIIVDVYMYCLLHTVLSVFQGQTCEERKIERAEKEKTLIRKVLSVQTL